MKRRAVVLFGRRLKPVTRSYVFCRPRVVFLPAVLWGRLRNHDLGVLRRLQKDHWIDRAFFRLGVEFVDLGMLPADFNAPSPWVAMRDPLIQVVKEECGRPIHEWSSDYEFYFFRGHVQKVIAQRILPILLAVEWAEYAGSSRVRLFSEHSLDARIATKLPHATLRVSFVIGLMDSALRRVGARLNAILRRGILRLKWTANVDATVSATGGAGLMKERGSARVLVVANHGLSYGSLYSYDYLLSSNDESPRHPRNVAYLARERRLLENGEQAVGFEDLLSLRGAFRAAQLAIAQLRLRSFRLRNLPSALRRLAFLFRAARYEAGLRQAFPDVRLAILLYDIQTPMELLYALRRLGVRSISNHERPQIGLVPYLPLVADHLMVESEFFCKALSVSEFAHVIECHPVGLWRSDALIEYGKALRSSSRPIVLVLPLTPSHAISQAAQPSELSRDGFRHFFNDILSLAEHHPESDFVIRMKSSQWIKSRDFVQQIARLKNLTNIEIGDDYEEPMEAYRLCAQARVVIAKYTSMVDEALASGIPVVIHDYTHNRHPGACSMSKHIPGEFFAHDFEELASKLKEHLTTSSSSRNSKLERVQCVVYGDLGDGQVTKRVEQTLDRILDEAKQDAYQSKRHITAPDGDCA